MSLITMQVTEISQTMSDAEHAALEAFQKCAQAFDAFNKSAATVVRSLLQENQRLNEEIASLKAEQSKLVGGTE